MAKPVPMNDRDLMNLRADVDFTYDAHGRMLCTNEPCPEARRPAPRLFVGWTEAGHVVRIGSTVPDDLPRRLEEVVHRQLPVGDLRAPMTAITAVRETLEKHLPVTVETSGPVYRFPPSIARLNGAVRLTVANRALVRETFPWLFDEIADWQPCFAVVVDGAAVSVCYSSRIDKHAAEAGVDTLSAFRGRGYAATVTMAWSEAVRKSGRIPFYSTGWDNLASQGVARRLGLIQFGSDFTWT
jgi:hypothetical protein